MSDRETTIYGLTDPRDGSLRYVGKTVKSLDHRLGRHLNDANRKKNRKDRWIARLISKDLRPEIFEIEVVRHAEWVEAERFWIAYFRAIGADLVNHTSGGEGEAGFHVAEDVKRRISIGNKGKPKSPEHVAKILAGPGIFKKGQPSHNKGKSPSIETRKRISAAQTGKPKGPQSLVHRANHKVAVQGINAGVPWSEARKAAYPNEKRTWTPERHAKRAATMAARKEAGTTRKDAGVLRTPTQKAAFNAKLAERRAAGWHPRWNPEGGRDGSDA